MSFSRISAGERNVVKVFSELGTAFVRRKVLNGREKEWGMWPDESPGRGSGSVPRYLREQRNHRDHRQHRYEQEHLDLPPTRTSIQHKLGTRIGEIGR